MLDDAITVGRLAISDSDGTRYYGKCEKSASDVHLHVVNDNFWFRILLYVYSLCYTLYQL